MSARRHVALAFLAAALSAACDRTPPPTPEGVGPAGSSGAPAVKDPPRVELARPEPAPVATPVEPAPPPPTAAKPAPQAGLDPDIADLGPFDLLTWDEARQRAAARITAENASAELEKLRVELENRP
jgi:hypothetical protein